MLPDEAPIAAIATAAGQGAVGIVRVSGHGLEPLVTALTGSVPAARTARYGAFRAADGSAIDHGLTLWFPAPHSYTGESVLELQGHGGPVVMQLLLDRVLEAGRGLGVRLAAPGEFTRRAYLNDKLDLAQAEAVMDLIEAASAQAARSAVRSLEGVFSARIGTLMDALVALRVLVESTLDFPDEEIDFIEAADAGARLAAIRAELDGVLQAARQGSVLRSGLTVVLAGPPNVGKSSLLNALAGREVAIVTEIAGTTRDRVTQTLLLDGLPVHVVDTAGLRETTDPVERLGIARTWEVIGEADVVVHLSAADALEPTAGEASLEARLRAHAPAHATHLYVCNKIDRTHQAPGQAPDGGVIALSARTGAGVELLRSALQALAGFRPGAEDVVMARGRHLEAIDRAAGHLLEAGRCLEGGDRMLELLAEELRLAHDALGTITGRMTADDLLGVIFTKFCIGK